MTFHFQPPYNPAYGVTRAKWRKLSGIEKTRLIQKYRDEENRKWFVGKITEEFIYNWIPMPFDPNRKFVPVGQELDELPF